MGAGPVEFLFCAKCGYLFIRSAGRAKKGWTHHDGTHNEQGRPNWCTCRTREPVDRRLHAAILGAEQVGGRAAAQSLLDQYRGAPAKRNPDRLPATKEQRARILAWYTTILPKTGAV